jgi:hypothetical protein
MNKLFPRFSLRRFRTHLALLLAYLTLITPLSPVFAQAVKVKRATLPATTQGTEQPGKGKGTTVGIDKHITLPAPNGAATAPSITATKTDNLSQSTQVVPGGTINYTVTITNNGTADATGVVFNDTVDTNTTVDASSAVLAADDDYNTIGNVNISVAAPGLLANDLDIDAGNNTNMTATVETKSSSNCIGCNNVSISSDGSFTYEPPVGLNGTDLFTYTAHTQGGKTATATAHIAVTGRIWFVNSTAGACSSACDGRRSHPFTSLASFQAINDNAATLTHAKTGDNIFIYESSAAYTGPVTLLSSQKLIGQDASATIETITGLSTPSGSTVLPAMNATPATAVNIIGSNANGINLGSGNTLRGFTVGDTGTGIKISGSGFGTLTVGNNSSPDVTLIGTGQALNLSTGTLSVAGGFASVATTSSATQGISLAGVSDSDGVGGSSFSFGSTSVSGSTTQGILIGTSPADISFGNTTVTASTDAVSFQNNSGGTRTFGTLGATAGGTGSAFLHGAGGGNVTVSGLATLQSGSGNTIDIQGQSASTTVSFSGGATLTKTSGGSGINVNNSTNGAVTFGGTLIIGTSGARFPSVGVTITGGSGTYSFNAVSIFTNGFTGITTTTGGTLNVTSGTVDVNAATALNVAGPAGLTTLGVTLTTVNSSGGTNNVNVTNATGTLTLQGGALSAASGAGFLVSGGNPTVSFAGTLTQNNAQRIVDVQNTTGGAISFTDSTTGVTGGASSTGININAANGNVSFAKLTLGTSGSRMTNQAMAITGGTGTYSLGAVSIFTSGTAQGIVATNADGTINCSSTSTVDASGATAINISGPAGLTTLGMTLTKVSSGGGTNGIALTNTSGSFTVNGDGTNNASGGTIQNSTGDGILLNNAQNISLTSMSIQNTVGSGVSGSNNVQNFSFVNGTINNSGTGNNTTFRYSNIAFNKGETAPTVGNEKNISGTLTVTGSTLTNSFFHGVVVFQFDGTLTDINISNNTFTSSTSQATSKGQGIKLVGFGSASTVAKFNKATINNNHINNFPSDAGILIQGGNATSAAAPAGVYGSDISTNAIKITNNVITGQSAAAGLGTQGILTATNGVGSGFFVITGNQITNVLGIGIATGANGDTTYTGIITGNTINAHNINSSAGIGGGTTNTFGTSDTPTYNVKIGDGTVAGANNISNTNGNGILMNSINGTGHTNVRILKNTVAAPVGAPGTPASGTTYGIRVAEGNINSSGDTICLDIVGNTTAGDNDGGAPPTIAPGIGLRRQNNTAQVFGIVGMAATSSPGVENYVNGLNTLSASGSFGTGGTALISATTGFSNCSEPAVLARATIETTNPRGAYLAQERNTFRNNAPFSITPTDTGDIASLIRSFSPASTFAPSASTAVSDDSTQIAAASNNTLDGASRATVNAAATLNDQTFVASDSAPREWSDIPASRAHLGESRADAAYFANSGASRDEARFVNATYRASDDDAFNGSHAATRDAAHRAGYATAQAGQQPVTKTGEVSSKSSRPAVVMSPTAVSVNIGTLKMGDSVQINFSVTVNTPFPNGVSTVSNQGTVSGSNFSNVLTDDPDVAGQQATVTQILTPPDIRANDAKVAEPALAQQTTMLFVVTLNHAFPPTGVSVNFATANGGATPAVGGASCDGSTDYITTSGTLSFSGSETLKTIPVTVCGTGLPSDKTLQLNLSSPSAGQVTRSPATGTITAANTPGTFLISELRTSGPDPDGAGPLTGADNDFIELYNNTDSPLTVASSDASAGYGLFKMGADCNVAPILIGTIPSGTVIPARGHFLFTGSAYGLGSYATGDQTLTANVETDHNVSVFTTADINNVSTATRLDAVGYGANTGGNACDLLREGATLAPIAANATTEHSYFRNLTTGRPADTNDNATDFLFADTQGSVISGVTQRLGAPGPENKTSPINRGATIKSALLDATVGSSTSPNRVRDSTSNPGNNSTFGTLSIRRRFTNNTGANVTRLRFRVVQVTTFPSPGAGVADVRLLTSSDVSQGGINDATTCNGATPCTVTVRGTTLESPPTQSLGGGLNSTVAAGTITPATFLAPGASVNVQFLLGVQTTGSFAFFVIVEGLP